MIMISDMNLNTYNVQSKPIWMNGDHFDDLMVEDKAGSLRRQLVALFRR